MHTTRLQRMKELRETHGSLAPYLAYMGVDEAALRRRFGEELFARARTASFSKNYAVVRRVDKIGYPSSCITKLLDMPTSFVCNTMFTSRRYKAFDEELQFAKLLLSVQRKKGVPLADISYYFSSIRRVVSALEREYKWFIMPEPLALASLVSYPLADIRSRANHARVQLIQALQFQNGFCLHKYDCGGLLSSIEGVKNIFQGHEALNQVVLKEGERAYLCSESEVLASRAVARGCEVHNHEEISD
jgi:hypothetical protein